MQEKIDKDITKALKSGDRATGEALKLLKNSLANEQIAIGHKLSDQETTRIIRREMKLRVEARDVYATNERQELAAKEEFERQIYASYLPDDIGPDQLNKIIDKIAKDIGGELNFGRLMSETMKSVAGQADGKTVSEAVKKYLAGI